MRHKTLTLLEDIRDAAQFIVDETTGTTLAAYRQDRRLRQVVERNFEIIGEAMRRLSNHDPATANRITEAGPIIAFRNVLIHAYDVVDHDRVWRVIHEALPTLKAEVEHLLREVEGEPLEGTGA